MWVDLFASINDNQEEIFMTEMNSAWNYDWRKFCSEGKYLWANPPFDDLKKVVTKACLEPCKIILVAPNWNSGNWKELLGKVATHVFEIPPTFPSLKDQRGRGCYPANIGPYTSPSLIPQPCMLGRGIWTLCWSKELKMTPKVGGQTNLCLKCGLTPRGGVRCPSPS